MSTMVISKVDVDVLVQLAVAGPLEAPNWYHQKTNMGIGNCPGFTAHEITWDDIGLAHTNRYSTSTCNYIGVRLRCHNDYYGIILDTGWVQSPSGVAGSVSTQINGGCDRLYDTYHRYSSSPTGVTVSSRWTT